MKKYIYSISGAIVAISGVIFWAWCVQNSYLYMTGFGIVGVAIGFFLMFCGYEAEFTALMTKLWQTEYEQDELEQCENCGRWYPKPTMEKLPEPQGYYICEGCYDNFTGEY